MSRQRDRKPCPGQREFDYRRQDRRNLIHYIQIPSFCYVNTRARRVTVHLTSTMKDLLKVIEDHCGIEPDNGWYFFVEEIAAEMSVDPRTASRAIADCIGGGLLAVGRSFYKHKRSHYQIIWSKVTEIILGNPDTAKWADTNSKTTPTTHDKASLTHDKSSFTHDKPPFVNEGHTSSSRTRTLTKEEPKDKPSWPNGKPNGYAGWPFKIELPHLRHSEAIERLWRAACERRDILIDPAADRERFYALARYVSRLAGLGEIANAGGYFHARIVRRDGERISPPNWLGEPRDFVAAREAIAYVDGKTAREGRSQ